MAQPADRPVAALDLAVFVAELALLAALAVAGYRLGSGGGAVVLAIVLPVVAALLWAGTWLRGPAARCPPGPASLPRSHWS